MLDGVFTKYNAGKIKGQKLKISELASGGDLKVHHLKSFAQIADPQCQLELLKELQRGQFTLDQFRTEARKVKGRQDCQRQFCRQVGVSTWQMATEEFPQHTSVEAMDRFHGISFKKRLPEVWTSHIRSAKKFKEDESKCTFVCNIELKWVNVLCHPVEVNISDKSIYIS